MKKSVLSFNIVDENLTIASQDGVIKNIKFPLRIKQVEDFDDVLVVRLDIPKGVVFNENIFGVSSEGKIIWQIAKRKSGFKYSSYPTLIKKGAFAKVHSWDGTDLLLDPKTGKVIQESYSK